MIVETTDGRACAPRTPPASDRDVRGAPALPGETSDRGVRGAPALPGVYVNENVDAIDLATALEQVSPERRAKALAYRFARDRKLSVAVYLLLKEALKNEYGIDENPRLAEGPNGKPYLADHPEIHFNLSHCAQAAACVVADRPVGIDVETIAPVNWEVARIVLSAEEQAAVAGDPEPDVAFARLWTRKEAYVKLTGEGIDEASLPDLLKMRNDVILETVARRVHGYVISSAMTLRRIR